MECSIRQKYRFYYRPKRLIVDAYNKGFLTIKGLAKKYKTKESIIKTIFKWGKQNVKEIKLRKGSANKEAVKSRCLNQYNELNPKQKALFREILEQNVADRRMPSNETLKKICDIDATSRIIEKFRKLLLILCNREDEINMTPHSISRLKQELKTWIKLAQQEKAEIPMLGEASTPQSAVTEETSAYDPNAAPSSQNLMDEQNVIDHQEEENYQASTPQSAVTEETSFVLSNQNLQNVPLYDDKLYKAVETLKVYENTTTENDIDRLFSEDGKSLSEKCGYPEYECKNILKNILDYKTLSNKKRRVLKSVVLKRKELNTKISTLNENKELYSLIQQGDQMSEGNPYVKRLNKNFRLILRTILGQNEYGIKKEEKVTSLAGINSLSSTWAILAGMEEGIKIKSEENSAENSSYNIIEISDDDTQAASHSRKRNADDKIVSSASKKRNKRKQPEED